MPSTLEYRGYAPSFMREVAHGPDARLPTALPPPHSSIMWVRSNEAVASRVPPPLPVRRVWTPRPPVTPAAPAVPQPQPQRGCIDRLCGALWNRSARSQRPGCGCTAVHSRAEGRVVDGSSESSETAVGSERQFLELNARIVELESECATNRKMASSHLERLKANGDTMPAEERVRVKNRARLLVVKVRKLKARLEVYTNMRCAFEERYGELEERQGQQQLCDMLSDMNSAYKRDEKKARKWGAAVKTTEATVDEFVEACEDIRSANAEGQDALSTLSCSGVGAMGDVPDDEELLKELEEASSGDAGFDDTGLPMAPVVPRASLGYASSLPEVPSASASSTVLTAPSVALPIGHVG